MKTLKAIFCTLVISGLIFSSTAFGAYEDELTIYFTKPNYKAAKYEPSNGLYLGSYVIQDTTINGSMKKFNELTNKHHASYFAYVGYGRPFPTKWVDDVKSVGAVPHIAFEPNNGLKEVQDNAYLREFAKEAKKADVPIFLRFASEMNGTWANYSGDTKKYIETWRMVHDIMQEEAPNVIMLWTVFTFPENTIMSYYPGDEYVDWVGVNIYNVMFHNKDLNSRGDHEDPLKLLDYVYNTFSYKKPIQISEFGASHYSALNNTSYIQFAINRISTMYRNLPTKYPRVKAIHYFDVNNLVNAPEGRKINDYSITNEPRILEAYSNLIKSDYYLSDVESTPENTIRNEKMSYRGFLFQSNGRTYVDLDFFTNYIGLKATQTNNTVKLSLADKSITVPIVNKRIEKGFDNAYRSIRGIPLRETLQHFGYKISFDSASNCIYIK